MFTRKFIQVEDTIYPMEALKKAHYCKKNDMIHLDLDGKHYRYKNHQFLWSSFECFIRNLGSDDLIFKSCFDFDYEINRLENMDEFFNKKDFLLKEHLKDIDELEFDFKEEIEAIKLEHKKTIHDLRVADQKAEIMERYNE